MKLYLDEDSADPLLAKLLLREGHDVQVPSDVRKMGVSDPVQLTHAVREQRVILTRNYRDFRELHELVLATGGHHPGILVDRRDNDPTRDLTARGIVRAITNLVASGFALADEYQVLNHWR